MMMEPNDYRLNQPGNGALDRLGKALSAFADLLAAADMSEAHQKLAESARMLLDAMHEALIEALSPAVNCLQVCWDELWNECELPDYQPLWRNRRYDTRTHIPRAQVMAHNTRHYHRRGFPN